MAAAAAGSDPARPDASRRGRTVTPPAMAGRVSRPGGALALPGPRARTGRGPGAPSSPSRGECIAGPSCTTRRPWIPARLRDIYSLAVGQQLFDGLVQFDQTLSITPALAQFWVASRDGLTWTFTLRKGVKFHHGREVTADDVVYSFTRLLDPRLRSGRGRLLHGHPGRVRVPGRTGQAGRPAWPRSTGTPFASPSPRRPCPSCPFWRWARRRSCRGSWSRSRARRSGPSRWARGRSASCAGSAARRSCWRRTPTTSTGPRSSPGSIFRIFPGRATRGGVRRVPGGALEDSPIPSKEYRQIIASQAYQYVRRPMFNLRHYGLNTRIKPLDDRRVRQALVHAIDREAVVSDVWLGRYTFAKGILPPGTLGFNPKLAGYPYDPARARELLAQAGHPGGRGLPPLTIWSSVRADEILREHERIRKDLEAVGIKAEFQYNADWPSFSRGDGGAEAADLPPRLVRRRPRSRELPREAVPLRQPLELHGLRQSRRWTRSSTGRGPRRTWRAGSRSIAGRRR